MSRMEAVELLANQGDYLAALMLAGPPLETPCTVPPRLSEIALSVKAALRG